MDFADKTVVITGGASGIGAALAELLVEKGARVALADRNIEAVQEAASRIGCMGFYCDVAEETQILTLLGSVQKELGEVDCFVSNAGVFDSQPSHVGSASNED